MFYNVEIFRRLQANEREKNGEPAAFGVALQTTMQHVTRQRSVEDFANIHVRIGIHGHDVTEAQQQVERRVRRPVRSDVADHQLEGETGKLLHGHERYEKTLMRRSRDRGAHSHYVPDEYKTTPFRFVSRETKSKRRRSLC